MNEEIDPLSIIKDFLEAGCLTSQKFDKLLDLSSKLHGHAEGPYKHHCCTL